MHWIGLAKALVLLTLANGTPVIAKKLLGSRLARPLDGGTRFLDCRPLFGPSKTVRGVVLAVAVCTAAAPLLGLAWWVGTVAGLAAMAGDLFSSFLKRRLGVAPSGMLPGLDQVPESLFPLLACAGPLRLGIADIAAGVAVFFVGELLLSRLLYRLNLRDRPY